MPAPDPLAIASVSQLGALTNAQFQCILSGVWKTLSASLVASCLGTSIAEITSSLSLNSSDHQAGVILKVNSASAVTLTVPADATYEFPLYHQIPILRYGAGQITIAAGAGNTVKLAGSRDNANGQNAVTYLIKTGANEWFFTGDTAST